MGIFDSIKNAIWGQAEDEAPVETAAPAQPGVATPATEAAKPAAPAAKADAPKVEVAKSAPAAAPAAAPATQAVDVTAILDAAAKNSGQTLNWRSSIVDLMKALGLESSLSARKELAGELGYTGDTADSAAMNIWLHGQVMRKLSENGGQVPADLL